MKKEKSRKTLIYTVISVIAWLFVWQLLAMAIGKPVFLPTAVSAAESLITLIGSATFIKSVGFSLSHILEGFLLGGVIGSALAVLAHKNEFLKSFIGLPVRVIKATPVASFTILALLWLTSQKLSILISCLMVIPVIYANLLTGLDHMAGDLLSMSEGFKVRPGKRLRYIYLPQLLPYISSACATAIGLAWKSGVAAEVIGNARNSIGNHLYQAKIYMEIPELFAWTLVTVAISVLTELLIKWILVLAERWILGAGDEKRAGRKAFSGESLSAAALVEGSVPVASEAAENVKEVRYSLEMKSVSKSFENKEVLKDFSMRLSTGESIALLGPSGIGKSTVLGLISGQLIPDSGIISWSASDASGRTTEKAAEKTTEITTEKTTEKTTDKTTEKTTDKAPDKAIVYQENRLVEQLSAYRNLLLVCHTGAQKKRIIPLLSALGLADDCFTRVSELSGGMKRRVAIGRALISDFPVLLLDEPFTGLDEDTKASVVGLINASSRHKMLLLVTHDEREAEAIKCGNTVVLRDRE